MSHIQRSALVPFSARQMFDLVNDVEAYPRRFEWCDGVQVRDRGPDFLVAGLDVRLGALRAGLFVMSGALAAGSVVLAGPIGFVGLVCPHLARLLSGPSHRTLVVGSALLGAGAIVAADAGVKLIDLGAGRMPLGVLTALVGGPVFIALLRREMLR